MIFVLSRIQAYTYLQKFYLKKNYLKKSIIIFWIYDLNNKKKTITKTEMKKKLKLKNYFGIS